LDLLTDRPEQTQTHDKRLRRALVLAFVVVAAGCQESAARSELPDDVEHTRSAILDAAADGDYAALRPLIKREAFLSDYGFGRSQPDPVAHWRKLGPKPLTTMGVLLRMPHQVRTTNEGTLYQWPRFGPDSEPGDMSSKERRLLRMIMTEAQLRAAIRPEYGYTAPRLGILADGTWWFFVLTGGP
jgi:hypothetical protein